MFEVLDSLSLPGDPQKPNEDAYLAGPMAAAVLDGATMVNDPLLPGPSDAAWIAQFGTRRLMAHIKAGNGPRAALRHALADVEHSFAGLRRRPLRERYELPAASMIFAVAHEGGFAALWFGDCAALVRRPDGHCVIVGPALEKRAAESSDAARLAAAKGVAPVGAIARPDTLPLFRAARSRLNTQGGTWLFSPEARASEHVAHRKIAAPSGSLALLCTDGFLALAGDYGAYDAASLVAAAAAKGLKPLGAELRRLEEDDPEGRRFPRFKKSDDATAVLLKLV